jgi:type II secretory pathway pseudopilin PulG
MRMRRGPGLLGTMARTAVVAGTATAVVGGMQRGQQARAEQAAQAQAYQQQQQQAAMQAAAQQAVAQQAQAAQPAPPPPEPPTAADLTTRLKDLADLNASGAITDAEFTAAKAKLLGM